MDLPTILIKITGVILLLWTAKSIYSHIKLKIKTANQGNRESQSISEQILNNILLYLWLVFMVVFSIGMIVNN